MHANAKLTVAGRRLLIARIQSGRPVAHIADELGISRATAYKWWERWRREGDTGLFDRSSRPRRSPMRTPRTLERRIETWRRRTKLGPARLGPILGLAPSTTHRVLVRLGLSRVRWMDRPTGRVIRRIVTTRPGELVHVDIKKLGRIPTGGGWRAHGRGNDGHGGHSRVGYAYIHSAVDAFTRLAYSEVLDNETAASAIAFWSRAHTWFESLGVTVERVLTDNGACYRGRRFPAALADAGVRHSRTRRYRPQTNGKVERFNRTLLEEWAYVRPYRSDAERTRRLARWLHTYNHHRCHTALGGNTPIETLDAFNNVLGQHS